MTQTKRIDNSKFVENMRASIEEALKAEVNQKVEELEKQVQDLKIVNNTVWMNSDDQMVELAEKEDEIERLQERSGEQKETIKDLRDQIEKLTDTNHQLLNALSSLEGVVKSLEDELQKSRREVHELTEKLPIMKNKS